MQEKSGIPATAPVGLEEEAKDYFKNYSEIKESRQNWIAFLGAPGTGKTTQAALLARLLIAKKLVPVRFYNAFNLTQQLIATRSRPAEYEAIFNEFERAPIVVLDDFLKILPATNSFEYANFKEAATRAIWARYDARKPLILTSQRTQKEFWNFDEALAGRVFEMCAGRVIEFGENSKNWRLEYREN